MDLISVEKFAKKVCVNAVMLRRMQKKDELTPTHISYSGMKHNKKGLKCESNKTKKLIDEVRKGDNSN